VILLQALGARLIGYDPAIHPSAPVWQQLQIKPVGLSELMASADAVSVQMLYASRYRHFIGHKVLAHCRRGQFWVSISRSDLFDPEALAEALTDGRIEACVLDGAEAGFAASGFAAARSGQPLHHPAHWRPHARGARTRQLACGPSHRRGAELQCASVIRTLRSTTRSMWTR
jgi:phosphoglycerate dehydrogenase-like enzyme